MTDGNDRRDSTNSPFAFTLTAILGVVFLLVTLSALEYGIVNRLTVVGFDLEDTARFGDSFGFVNTIFSGLAFALLIVTLYLQLDELKLQREDLRHSLNVQQEIAQHHKEASEIQKWNTQAQEFGTYVGALDAKRQLSQWLAEFRWTDDDVTFEQLLAKVDLLRIDHQLTLALQGTRVKQDPVLVKLQAIEDLLRVGRHIEALHAKMEDDNLQVYAGEFMSQFKDRVKVLTTLKGHFQYDREDTIDYIEHMMERTDLSHATARDIRSTCNRFADEIRKYALKIVNEPIKTSFKFLEWE